MSNDKIEVSRELLERLDRASRSMGWEGFSQELRALLAVPAVQPQSEPEASGYIQGVGERFIGKAEYDPRNGYVIPIYTSPPALVAVVLPERKPAEWIGMSALHTSRVAYGWNACLDEVKRLNP